MTYVNTASRAQLASGISSGATSVTLASYTGWPVAFPFYAIIDRGTGSAEIVLVTGGAGSTLTVTRAQGGTLASAHNGGAYFEHVVPAEVFTNFESHMAASTGVHGVSGSVVGTSGAQTLTDKAYRGGYTHAFADSLPAGLSAGFEVTASSAIARDGFKVTNTGADTAKRAFLLEQSGTPRYEVYQDGTVKTSPNSAHTRPGNEVNTAATKPAVRVTNSSSGNATTFETLGNGNTTVGGTLGVTGTLTPSGQVDLALQAGGTATDRAIVRTQSTQNALAVKDSGGFNLFTIGGSGNVDASGYLATASTLSATGTSTLTGDVTLPLPAASTTPRLVVNSRTGGQVFNGKNQAGTVTSLIKETGEWNSAAKMFIHNNANPVVAKVAATSDVPSPTTNMIVLDDSDGFIKKYNGTSWDSTAYHSIKAPRGHIARLDPTTDRSGLTNTEVMGDTITFNAVSGRIYKFTFSSRFSLNTTGVAVLELRIASGATVTTSSTQLRDAIPTGSANNGEVEFTKCWVATGTGQFTVGVGASVGAGASSGTLYGGAGGTVGRMLLVEDIGS